MILEWEKDIMEAKVKQKKMRKPMTEETKRKIAESMKGRKLSLETKQKIADSMSGSSRSVQEKTREMISRKLEGNSNAKKRIHYEEIASPMEVTQESVAEKVLQGLTLNDEEQFLQQANKIRGVFKEEMFDTYLQAKYHYKEHNTFRGEITI